MPEKCTSLTEDVKGLALNPERMRNAGWYLQSSSRYHYGLPRTRGLWVYSVEPFEQCRHHPVMLFLLVRAAAKGKVSSVETMVCQCYTDGSYDELDVPFNPFDLLTAKTALEAALTPAAREDLHRRRSTPDDVPLVLADLQALIGTYLDAGPGGALVERLNLEKSLDLLGQGNVYCTHGKPLEVHTNHVDKVRSILLKPRRFDVLESGSPGRLVRGAIRARFGPPGLCPPEAQVAYDRFETPKHVTLVTYDGDGNATNVSIYAPEVAP